MKYGKKDSKMKKVSPRKKMAMKGSKKKKSCKMVG